MPVCTFPTSAVFVGGICQTLASYLSTQVGPTATESGGHAFKGPMPGGPGSPGSPLGPGTPGDPTPGGPGWRLRARHDFYARWPKVFGLVFMFEIPFRARRELTAALPERAARRAFTRTILRTVVVAPISPTRMARRARLIASYDVVTDCARISVPTLVVTGEAELDHVVSVHGSSRYSELIAGAVRAVLPRTGHQGTLTHADAFAATVREFAARQSNASVRHAHGDRTETPGGQVA